ncbi:phosphotransferase [Parasphingorhabdus pacifica]
MSEFLSSAEIAERTSNAVDAAVSAARELGIDATDPKILHDAFSVVVHLAPSPVVARVPTVLPPTEDLAAQQQRQRTELHVSAWLHERGIPVVEPSPLAPREPVLRNGFSLTFWRHVQPREDAEPDYVANTVLVAHLHAALRDYPGELPFLSGIEPTIEQVGDFLAQRPDLIDPADLDRARREWATIAPLIESREKFEAAYPGADVQPIHGDAPAYNIIDTSGGKLHADFETLTSGPVEWDLAQFGPEAAARYNTTAAELGIRGVDDEVLRLMDRIGNLRGVACLALAPQLPMLVDALKPLLDAWRNTTSA